MSESEAPPDWVNGPWVIGSDHRGWTLRHCSSACRDAWKPKAKAARRARYYCGEHIVGNEYCVEVAGPDSFCDKHRPTAKAARARYCEATEANRGYPCGDVAGEDGFCEGHRMEAEARAAHPAPEAGKFELAPYIILTAPIAPHVAWCGLQQQAIEAGHPTIDALDAYWDERDRRGYCRRACLDRALAAPARVPHDFSDPYRRAAVTAIDGTRHVLERCRHCAISAVIAGPWCAPRPLGVPVVWKDGDITMRVRQRGHDGIVRDERATALAEHAWPDLD